MPGIEPIICNSDTIDPQSKSVQSIEDNPGLNGFFSLISQLSQGVKTDQGDSFSESSDNNVIAENKSSEQKSSSTDTDAALLSQDTLTQSLGFFNFGNLLNKVDVTNILANPPEILSEQNILALYDTASNTMEQVPQNLPEWQSNDKSPLNLNNSPDSNRSAPPLTPVSSAGQALTLSPQGARELREQDQYLLPPGGGGLRWGGELLPDTIPTLQSPLNTNLKMDSKGLLTLSPSPLNAGTPVSWESGKIEEFKPPSLLTLQLPGPYGGEIQGEEVRFLDSQKSPVSGQTKETPLIKNVAETKPAPLSLTLEGPVNTEGQPKENVNKGALPPFDGGSGEETKESKEVHQEFSGYFKQEEDHLASSDKSPILSKSALYESTKWPNGQPFVSSGPKFEEESTPMQPVKSFEENIMKQMIEKTFVNMGEDRTEIRISLKPDSLGRVYLELDFSDDHLQAKIFSENQLVKEAVENNLDQLKEALGDKGLKVERMEVFILPSLDSVMQIGQRQSNGSDSKGFGFNMGMNSNQRDRGRNRDQSYPKPEEEVSDNNIINLFI